jgi:hypothetical protein
MLCALLLLFVLCYFLNPLNGAMRHSLTGPVGVLIRMISPELMLACGKFLLAILFISAPGLLLGPLFAKHVFLKTGSLSGFICSAVSFLNFTLLRNGEFEGQAWYVIAPFFAAVYFLLGFVGGGLWGLIGKRLLRP